MSFLAKQHLCYRTKMTEKFREGKIDNKQKGDEWQDQ